MKCPRCDATLTPKEIKALWGAYTNSQRKTKGGGRPKGSGKKTAPTKQTGRDRKGDAQ